MMLRKTALLLEGQQAMGYASRPSNSHCVNFPFLLRFERLRWSQSEALKRAKHGNGNVSNDMGHVEYIPPLPRNTQDAPDLTADLCWENV